jgi:hypothetical protein
MYLRQAGLTRNPTFSYLYCVRCRGQGVASEAPLERKYSRCSQCADNDVFQKLVSKHRKSKFKNRRTLKSQKSKHNQKIK